MGRTGAERGIVLGTDGEGVEKVECEPRLVAARSAWAREAGANAFSLTGNELMLGDGKVGEGVPMRGELVVALAVGAGNGVLHTE